jgi:hypothetical protein
MCQIIIHGQLTKDGFPASELGSAYLPSYKWTCYAMSQMDFDELQEQ